MSKDQSTLFKELFTVHQGMVRQMCLGYMKGNLDDAEDLVQEVFSTVWKNLDRFRGESQYKTWIYRITVNSCLHQIRKQKKQKSQSWDNMDLEPSEESPELKKEELLSSMYRAIGQLEEIDRLIIMMSLEGEKQASIAEVLGIQPGNVRVRIHRIKKNLAEQLKAKK